MRLFRKLIGRLSGKRKKKSKLFRYIAITPFCIAMALVVAFFAFDDFNLYIVMLFRNQAQSNLSERQSGTLDNWTVPPSYGSSGQAGGMLLGEQGLSNMYINSMSEGYFREYLEILRDHCNWKYMSDEVDPVKQDGQTRYPAIASLIGLAMSEGGLESEGQARVSTPSPLSRLSYKQDGKHTLYTYNSAVAAADGGSTLNKQYFGSLDLFWAGSTTVRTNFQFTGDMAAIYPSGRLHAQANKYPSKFNGYGVPDGTVRTLADTDAAFFPDDISIAIQRAWVALGASSSFDVVSAKSTTLQTAMYPVYNYGSLPNAFACGGHKDGGGAFTKGAWNSANQYTYAQVMTGSMNYLDDLIEQILCALCEDYDGYVKDLWDGGNYAYANHDDYRGLFVASVLLNGGFVSQSNVSTLQSYADAAGFQRGATLAYRIFKGDKTATVTTVREWLRNPTVKDISTSYGRVNDSIVYYYNSEFKVVPDAGGPAVTALHAYSKEVRGPFIARVAGNIIYWKMLKAAGVECTFADAYKDSQGLGVTQISSQRVQNEAIARAAVSYAQPTRDSGIGNNGTKLWQAVHDAILPGDVWYRSCDRTVCVAVRWSGADNNYPPGGCYAQIGYVLSSPKWEEVKDWGGNPDNLWPGDILIRSDRYETGVNGGIGHTLLYAGNQLIREYFPNAIESYVQVSGSKESTLAKSRSPALGGWYTDKKEGYQTYRIFRCVGFEENPLYKDIIINVRD